MIENKRFQYNVNKNTIEQNGKFVAYMNSVDGARITNKLNELADENEQLKSENKRLKRLTTQYHVIDIEKVLPAIAECKGITVEEYLEEIEEEYTKEGDLE